MSTQPKLRYTQAEYLSLERTSETKHEYFAGEIFAMGGASERHVIIVNNLVTSFVAQFRGRPCITYSHDMRVKVDVTELYTYPDLALLCGEARFDDVHKDTLLNPQVLIEVLSPSTEAYDRGRNFEQYRQLEALREYLLVAQDRPHIEHYRRQNGNEWVVSEATGLDATLMLPAIECQLALRDVYDKVDLQAAGQAEPFDISLVGRPDHLCTV